jgi:Domain of unknown function (DUF5943)
MPNNFEDLISRLELSPTGSLTVNGMPMVLMPLHFFRYILREVHKAVSPEVFRKIYWQAGFDGAVAFCASYQQSHGCSPLEAVQGYLDEMSIRGWGHFSIESVDPQAGSMEVLLRDSSLASEGDIPSGNLAWEGAMLGSMSFLQAKLGIAPDVPGRVQGREVPGEKPGQMDFHISVAKGSR